MSNGTFPIRTLNAISPVGLQRLDRDIFDLGTDIARPRGILVRSADLHSMEIPDSLYAVARAGAGTNNIPVEELAARGIVVFNTPGANANAVKELVVAGMLLAAALPLIACVAMLLFRPRALPLAA